MKNIEAKKAWLKNDYTKRLAELKPDTERLWGKMNVQQMIEHMSDYLRIANGRTAADILTPEEHLDKAQSFLMSEKPFKENTPNALLPDEPSAVRHPHIGDALQELQSEVDNLYDVYEKNPTLKVAHPFFGHLDFDMNVQLLHKHAWHHLRQFGINE